MERQLTTIKRIKEILPHDNADALEIARIDGWVSVVKKEEFKQDDLIVFCEIDSILPKDRPEFEFLAPKYRVKTVRLRGVTSQGICFPLSLLPQREKPYEEDEDVTEILGVVKYERYSDDGTIGGQPKGSFPDFLIKTDETRIQNIPWVISKYMDKTWEITEKLEGSSCSIYIKDGEAGVCSRNNEYKLEDPTNIFVEIFHKYNLAEKLPLLNRNICVQGELVGLKVNGNKHKLTERDIYIFSIFDIDAQKFLPLWQNLNILKTLGLKNVPIINPNFQLDTSANVDKLLDMAKGQSLVGNLKNREGLVFKCNEDIFEPKLQSKLSFKAINPEFLLKEED